MAKFKKVLPFLGVALVPVVLFFVYVYDPNPAVCKDSDNANIYAKGTCRINGTSYTDGCSGAGAKEYFCGADNSCVYIVSACPPGSGCVNGACVNATGR